MNEEVLEQPPQPLLKRGFRKYKTNWCDGSFEIWTSPERMDAKML